MNIDNLNSTLWDNKSILEFNKFFKSLSNAEKIYYTKKMSKSKKQCLGINAPTLKILAKQILRGDAKQFLSYQTLNFLEDDLLASYLLSEIKDNLFVCNYLTKFLTTIDSWEVTDALKIKVCVENFNFAKECLNSEFVFKRRFGFVHFLKYCNNEAYLTQIFKFVLKFKDEQEYYINMAIAWLLCECVVKNKNKTFVFFNTFYKQLNKFVLKKTISKCQDSFRILAQDKLFLKKYLIK